MFYMRRQGRRCLFAAGAFLLRTRRQNLGWPPAVLLAIQALAIGFLAAHHTTPGWLFSMTTDATTGVHTLRTPTVSHMDLRAMPSPPQRARPVILLPDERTAHGPSWSLACHADTVHSVAAVAVGASLAWLGLTGAVLAYLGNRFRGWSPPRSVAVMCCSATTGV